MGQRRTTGSRKKTQSIFRATRCYSRASATISTMVLWCQNKLSFLPDLLIFLLQTQVPGLKASGITMNLNLALVKIASPGRSRKGMSSQAHGEVIMSRDLSTSEKFFFFFRRAGLAVNALQIRITAGLDDKNICCCDRMHTFIQNQERERLKNMRYSSIIVCAQGGMK